jgi:hypothetical protein
VVLKEPDVFSLPFTKHMHKSSCESYSVLTPMVRWLWYKAEKCNGVEATQCEWIFLSKILELLLNEGEKTFLFYISPELAVWQHSAGQTEAQQTGALGTVFYTAWCPVKNVQDEINASGDIIAAYLGILFWQNRLWRT